MDKNSINTTDINDLIYLLICAVNDKTPDIERINSMNLGSVYELANYHSLAAMVAFSLERVITLPYEYDQAKKKAIRKLALFDLERSKIFRCFEKEQIWYLPLKGSVIKDYYPRYGMREMSDNDILCNLQRIADVNRIMGELGFQCEEYNKSDHDVYTKTPLVFEIHRVLFGGSEMNRFTEYYNNISDRLLKPPSIEYERSFSPEDFYIYMLAHEFKHYIYGGTGLRSLIDIFVFIRKYGGTLDWEYITNELAFLGIVDFEMNNRELSYYLFNEIKLSETMKEELLYYVTSGTHGTLENSINNRIAREFAGNDSNKQKRKYIRNRLFLRGDALKNKYPFFYKHQFLLPVFDLYRIIRNIIKRPKRLICELKTINRFKYTK